MAQAATFLAASVSVLIGSRNGKSGRRGSSTLLRIVLFRRTPFCLEMLAHSASSHSRSHSNSRSDVYLASFRFIRLRPVWLFVRSFVHLSVYLSIRSSVLDRRIRSYISVHRDVHCPIIFLRQSLLAPFPRNFLFSFLFFSPLTFTSPRILIRGLPENAPLRYYILTRE